MTKLTVGRPLAVQHLDKLFNPYLKKIKNNLQLNQNLGKKSESTKIVESKVELGTLFKSCS